jgi:benzil reductase ((S)-benzoin forming)
MTRGAWSAPGAPIAGIDWIDENCRKGEPGMESHAQMMPADAGNGIGPPKVFITGNSSGLGRGLSDACLDRGWEVYGLSRRGAGLKHARLRDVQCDLAELETIPAALETLLGEVDSLDLVFLNAGILGEIQPMTDVPLDDLRTIMEVNVWANKVILDWLHERGLPVRQIVAISSGAGVVGNRGWAGYALSKATLNMLIRLYSHEFPGTHLSALAPGLVDSEMMDYLCVEPDPEEFPTLERIRRARGTEKMPGPREAAERILEVLSEVLSNPSGDYADLRQMLAPEEYEELLKRRDRPAGGGGG